MLRLRRERRRTHLEHICWSAPIKSPRHDSMIAFREAALPAQPLNVIALFRHWLWNFRNRSHSAATGDCPVLLLASGQKLTFGLDVGRLSPEQLTVSGGIGQSIPS